jgi:hypothetical protein
VQYQEMAIKLTKEPDAGLQERLALYKAGKPYHEPATTPAEGKTE